jgi:hypothetical protein
MLHGHLPHQVHIVATVTIHLTVLHMEHYTIGMQ